jgi:hypothetical protein
MLSVLRVSVVMLSGTIKPIILSVVMLNVVILNVYMLSVTIKPKCRALSMSVGYAKCQYADCCN